MASEILIRPFRPGEPSLVCYFQYKLYEEQFHFNVMYEKEMLSGMSEIYDDPEGHQMWIAERDGEIVGDVAILRRGEHEAQLRWFGVALSMQGQGLGSRLLQIAMDFCKEKGYTHVMLGTLDILEPARHLYGKFGFRMTESEPFDAWADNWPMAHEIWRCEL
ncbi:MAG TPA: GNAT family N-acetyltransferase [Candidatus Acidoferrum sp.]|nr:GNAT family N-acetyltransferase [Candidatus Acidoferrum sp.]